MGQMMNRTLSNHLRKKCAILIPIFALSLATLMPFSADAKTVNGTSKRDTLRGGAGNDRLSGGPLADQLWGHGGDDRLA
jgi:hypothetical protein